MLKKYNKTYNIDKTLLPNIFSLLKAVPEDYLYFKHYSGVRHPGGILVRATEEIVNSMNKILVTLPQVVEDLKADDRKAKSQELLAELQSLIGHFDSFQDECYLALKGLCAPPETDACAGEIYVHKWLKGNGYACGENFLVRTKNIQKYVDMFSNGLKHGNRRFDFVSVQAGQYFVPGVFIDELKGDQVKERYPWLSDKMLKSTVAFSFNYLLQALTICFYTLCDDLEDSIKTHLKVTKGYKFGKVEKEKHTDAFADMILGVARLPKVFYPYEHKKAPKVAQSGNSVKVSYPHGDRIPYSGQLQASSVHTADGYTKDFSLPFFG